MMDLLRAQVPGSSQHCRDCYCATCAGSTSWTMTQRFTSLTVYHRRRSPRCCVLVSSHTKCTLKAHTQTQTQTYTEPRHPWLRVIFRSASASMPVGCCPPALRLSCQLLLLRYRGLCVCQISSPGLQLARQQRSSGAARGARDADATVVHPSPRTRLHRVDRSTSQRLGRQRRGDSYRAAS